MLWWGLFDFIALSLSAVRYERHQPTCKISCFSTQQAQRFRPVMKTERERNAKLWLWLCGCRAVRVVFFQNASNLTVYFRLSLFIVLYTCNFQRRRTTVGIRAMPYKANFIASNFRNWRLVLWPLVQPSENVEWIQSKHGCRRNLFRILDIPSNYRITTDFPFWPRFLLTWHLTCKYRIRNNRVFEVRWPWFTDFMLFIVQLLWGFNDE